MNGWKITAPLLSDDERDQVIKPGGLSGAAEPTDYARAVLVGLQSQAHIYAGTVPPEVIAERRRRNRQARKSRRINRRRAR